LNTIVISQPMFIPWLGLFEQIKMSDIYVHMDDVQLPRGRSFTTRVQIKTQDGVKWMSVPVKQRSLMLPINEVMIDNSTDWKAKHIKTIKYNYSKCLYFNEMYELLNEIYSCNSPYLCDFNMNAIELICDALKITPVIHKSSEFNIEKKSSERVLDIVKNLSGNIYITGHGAKNYMDYSVFENNDIEIKYIKYACKPYPQMHGDFTPYVSIMDLIANAGINLDDYFASHAVNWKDFV